MDPPIQIAALGDNVTFKCTVTNISPFTVMWMSDRTSKSNQSSLCNRTVTLPLTLTNVTKTDYRTYICSAEDNNNKTFAIKYALLSKLTYQLYW